MVKRVGRHATWMQPRGGVDRDAEGNIMLQLEMERLIRYVKIEVRTNG